VRTKEIASPPLGCSGNGGGATVSDEVDKLGIGQDLPDEGDTKAVCRCLLHEAFATVLLRVVGEQPTNVAPDLGRRVGRCEHIGSSICMAMTPYVLGLKPVRDVRVLLKEIT
jgi:hypothetical protein